MKTILIPTKSELVELIDEKMHKKLYYMELEIKRLRTRIVDLEAMIKGLIDVKNGN